MSPELKPIIVPCPTCKGEGKTWDATNGSIKCTGCNGIGAVKVIQTLPRELKPGDHIKDNDPRIDGRVLVIGSVGRHSCTAQEIHGGRQTTISLDRIHLDEKPRRSGFSLIP